MSNVSVTQNSMLANFMLSLMMGQVVVPSDQHDQAKVVQQMLRDDTTGMIDSLTDFMVNSANVDYTVETDNDTFTEKLQNWLTFINSGFEGRIPRGIDALAKEYFQERWKGASFPILKILKWGSFEGLVVPTEMVFVDGASVYAKEKVTDDVFIKQVEPYNYYLGHEMKPKNKLSKGVIITKPFGRFFQKYPSIFLIKRGIFHNFKIFETIKNTQLKVLDQVIPYMHIVKRGTENLAIEGKKVYTQAEFDKIAQQMQDYLDDWNNKKTTGSTSSREGTGIRSKMDSVRATQFDETNEHFMPDMEIWLKEQLFSALERHILSGLGFIDIADALSENRREAILNPKGFVSEVKQGVEDFKSYILKELLLKIVERNSKHRKYINSNVYITSSPIEGFSSDKFKNLMRQLYERGLVSKQTTVELVGEIDFQTEEHRRKTEAKNGVDDKMFPPVTKNPEDVGGTEAPTKETPETDENGKTVPNDKIDDKDEFKAGTEAIELEIDTAITEFTSEELKISPYKTMEELPPEVSKLSLKKQSIWFKAFNASYKVYLKRFKNDTNQAEASAFATAWSRVDKRLLRPKKKIKEKK